MRNKLIGFGIIFIIALGITFSSFETIPAGHVGVVSLFGKVQDSVYTEGLHLINPLTKVTLFDAREKTVKDSMNVPSQDQLLTKFDLSIQYRLIKEMAPTMLKETGTPQEVIDVHMMPLLRSSLREIGKSVLKAEGFYEQTTQQRMQTELLTALFQLTKKGIKIEKLLIRDVVLPSIITNAVQRKKEAAQAAEKAKEELKKFRIDQERKEAQANAEKKAAVIEATKKAEVALTIANGNLEAAKINAEATLIRAKAEALARQKQIDVVGRKLYGQLEALKVLPQLANGNHVFMMDQDSNVLPFMNMTEMVK